MLSIQQAAGMISDYMSSQLSIEERCLLAEMRFRMGAEGNDEITRQAIERLVAEGSLCRVGNYLKFL